jgi:hypothetical protein
MRSKLTLSIVAGLVAALVVGPAWGLTFQVGDVFASVNSGNVQIYRSGPLIATLNTGQGGYTTGSTTDSAGNFYVTNFSAGTVSKFAPDGTSLGVVATGLSSPESILLSSGGTAYVGQAGGPISTFSGSTFPVSGNTDWIDLSSNQTTFYYTHEGNSILRYDTGAGQLSDFATGLPGSSAFALRILPNGDVLVADSGLVVLLDSGGSTVRTYTTSNSDPSLFSLNLDPDGTSFWTGGFSTGLLYQFDIATAAQLTVIDTGSGYYNLFGVSVYGEYQAGGGGVGGGDSNTPLPAALPLFATGLGALGLLGWRRKKKAAAIAA